MDDAKIAEALQRIKKIYFNYRSTLILGHSGGKDSQVILHLTKQIYPDIPLVHNPKPMAGTSNEPLTEMEITTLEFLYSVSKEHVIHFVPSDKMKEFCKTEHFHCQIDGSRASESTRKGKSADFCFEGREVSRKHLSPFINKGIFGLAMSYPIYDWTDNEIFEYILINNIPISREYLE